MDREYTGYADENVNEEALTRHFNTPHSEVGKVDECEMCGGDGVVIENPGEDNEREIICPDCYEEEDYSGATNGDR